jgi:hypothetical protein
MAGGFVPPVDAVLARYGLQLIQPPALGIGTHGFEHFRSGVHGSNDTTISTIGQSKF